MPQSFSKYITTFLFLVAFLVPRIADIHALEHLQDDDEGVSCDLCDITSYSQQFDLFLDVAAYYDNRPLNAISCLVVYGYFNSPLDKIVSPTSIYNKPPPHLIIG